MKKGVLLINLGTPDQCDGKSIRRYLREFLNDPRVIDLPWYIRWPLVNLLIIPFRFKATTHAYSQVWTQAGSPLLTHTQNLAHAVAERLGNEYHVVYGMRYGHPTIASALQQLSDCDSIAVLPLFPQYSSAATGSALEEFYRRLLPTWNQPSISVTHDFYNHPGFIQACAESAASHVTIASDQKNTSQASTQTETVISQSVTADYILFSYHGLPERHIQKSDCKLMCRGETACPVVADANRFCYRAQCYETTRLIAQQLGLPADKHSVSFQSRLGRTPWITPYTDLVLPELYKKGVRHLAVICPSFVSDCLETLEEINMRARKQWLALGGTSFSYIPCVNESSRWVDAVAEMVKR